MARMTWRWWRIALAVVLALGALGALRPMSVLAASFVVTNTADAGAGSLRQALLNAQASPGADTIGFALPGSGPWTINLTSTLPIVTQPLTITGPGIDRLTIQPAPTIALTSRFPLLVVIAPGQAVSVAALTLSGGRATSNYGGNLRSTDGNLTLTDVALRGGTAPACQGGAGAYVSNGTIQLIRTTISGNSAPGCGGTYAAGAGLYVDEAYGGVDLTIAGGSIVGNTATGSAGGGLAIERISGVAGRTLTAWLQSVIIGSSEAPNAASTYGGGLSLKEANVTLADSVVLYNTAAWGGGIVQAGGTLTLERSYVGWNRTTSGDYGHGSGGGIYKKLGTLTLNASTIIGNTSSRAAGGGIYNRGTLTINGGSVVGNASTSAIFSDNRGGGGIYSADGAVAVTNATIASNTTGTWGGGIRLLFGSLTLTNSTVNGNVAHGGGGVYNVGATVTIAGSTIATNSAAGGGAGLANVTGPLFLTGSTVSGNVAGAEGGGIYHGQYGADTLSVTNSTISGNRANLGGGLYNSSGGGNVSYTTITGNSASQAGGVSVVGSLALRGSIVAGNSGGDCAVGGGAFTSNGFNVIPVGAGCAFGAPGDLAYAGPLAALLNPALASNGGPTQTHALPAGSAAIDRIPAAHCAVATDQRGVARPQGAGCDSGSYEAP